MLLLPWYPNFRFLIGLTALAGIGVCPPSVAQQKVVLKTGTTILGKASLQNGDVNVEVGESTLTVPLAEVQSIDAAAESDSARAARLLQMVMENAVASKGAELDYRLLAEAHRLAPQNSTVTFWYAYALVEQEEWEVANSIYTANQAEIAAAYPELSSMLEQKLKKRVESSHLPPALQTRLETIDKMKPTTLPEMQGLRNTPYYSLFHLVDQHGHPIDRRDFTISPNHSNDSLEAYPDGYYLHRFDRRSGSFNDAPTIEITRPGYRPFEFRLEGTPFTARDYGDLVVHRLSESEMQEVVVLVKDNDDIPLPNVTVRIQMSPSRFSGSETSEDLQTDAEGRVTTKLYPFDYRMTCIRSGYTGIAKSLNRQEFSEATSPIDFTMYRQLRASASLTWGEVGEGKTPNTVRLEMPSAGSQAGDANSFLQLRQIQDKLSLTPMYSSRFDRRPYQAAVYRITEDTTPYEDIELGDVDAIISNNKAVLYSDGRTVMTQAESLTEGDVLVGYIDYRDGRTGDESRTFFKARIDSLEPIAITTP